MKLRRAAALFTASLILTMSAGCRKSEERNTVSDINSGSLNITDSATLKTERDNFYGICHVAYEETLWKGTDYKKSIKTIKTLGAKSIRLWIHASYVMDDPETYRPADIELIKKIIAEAQANDLEIIGVNHHWFSGFSDHMAVPPRDLQEGSAYRKFLLNYDTTWYNLVKAFPEIRIWEIGNEWNNDTFLHPYEYRDKGEIFTFSEKVKITTDMLYYASRGIHRADPTLLTVFGGLIDIYQDGYGNAKNFFAKVYDGIFSGEYPSLNPDDYFQMIARHPYNLEGDISEEWIEHNISIYEMIKEYEGHDKPVYFTEFGWTDYGNAESDAKQAQYMRNSLTVIWERMPFVKTVHWFRLFNDSAAASWGGEKEVNFGLFEEPSKGYTPKEKGKMFYELTGGTGDLYEFAGADN